MGGPCWHRTAVHVLKLKSGRFSCPVGGSSSIQSHFLRCHGWQSMSKWHLQLSVLRLCLLQELSTWSLLQSKSSFPRVQGSSAHGPALDPEANLAFLWLGTVTCMSPVMAGVCPSAASSISLSFLVMSEHWNCGSSALPAVLSFPVRAACTGTVIAGV